MKERMFLVKDKDGKICDERFYIDEDGILYIEDGGFYQDLQIVNNSNYTIEWNKEYIKGLIKNEQSSK